MPATRQRSVYHGWVVLSFFLICGSVAILSIPVLVAELEGAFFKYLLVGCGSLIGGLVAGWTCPYPRMNEVGAAAVAVVLFMVAVLLYTPVGDATFVAKGPDAGFVLGAIAYGGIALASSLVGAWLGNRIQWREPTGWRVFALSTLFAFGVGCALVLVVAAVFADRAAHEPSNAMVGMIFLALAVSAFAAGAMTQAAIKHRGGGAIGFGPFAMMTTLALVGVLTDDSNDELIPVVLGIAVITAILYGLARWGGMVAYRLQSKPEDHIPSAVVTD